MLDKAVTNGSEVFALPLGNVHKGCSGWVLSQRHPPPNSVEEPTPPGRDSHLSQCHSRIWAGLSCSRACALDRRSSRHLSPSRSASDCPWRSLLRRPGTPLSFLKFGYNINLSCARLPAPTQHTRGGQRTTVGTTVGGGSVPPPGVPVEPGHQAWRQC